MQDLHELPRLRDSLTYLYIDHAIVERKEHAIEFLKEDGRVHVPAAALCVLMLGPGTSITHAAIRILAEYGCTVLWTAEEGTQFYAQGTGETRKAYHLLRQAELASNPEKRMQVVLRMYRKRFGDQLGPDLTLPQIRGLEGVRMRRAYAQASRTYGVRWEGRKYDRQDWSKGDPINRALSAANAVLNGVCHAAIVSGGFSPAIGFIHTGKQLSFVYDIADLYKVDLTIPTAFQITAQHPGNVERWARMACRDKFREVKLLDRILPDIHGLLGVSVEIPETEADMDSDPALPEALWGPLLSVAAEDSP